ncbi:brassinosteroid-responsive RING protein 1-like [Wolffia australiana]
MGFPVGYSELMLPKILLYLVFFMGQIRRVLGRAWEPASAAAPPPRPARSAARAAAAVAAVREMLAVATAEDLAAEGWAVPEACAVCLHEMEAEDEVRRPMNCRHVFHRGCLERWAEQDRRTCPLCRAPLVRAGPAEVRSGFPLSDPVDFLPSLS